jgi:hypothetical protein
VFKSAEDVEKALNNLSRSIPNLLRNKSGKEFWAEFLRGATAIKEQASLDQFDWVTERIYGILAMYGLPPPSRWLIGALATAGAEHETCDK